LLGGVAVSVFAFLGNLTYGFVVVLVTFVSIILAVLAVFLLNKAAKTSPEQLKKLVGSQVSAPSWARLVPKVPISPPEKLGDFQLSVRQNRTTAVTLLNEVRKKAGRAEIDPQHVRANVFLAKTDQMQESGALVLIIPRQMHDNMSNFKDRDIKILPHEGLTGRTFTLGEACGATAILDGAGKLNWSKVALFPTRPSSDEWERFTLSEEQNALIGSRLRWIVSFPLKYDGEGHDKTFGVLNIDGIDDQLTVDDMRSLAGSIEPNVAAFAKQLGELPKVRITIRVEDVP
jgi:hypothetical protein